MSITVESYHGLVKMSVACPSVPNCPIEGRCLLGPGQQEKDD